MNALERLESTLASLRKDVPTVRVGGTVSEVSADALSGSRACHDL